MQICKYSVIIDFSDHISPPTPERQTTSSVAIKLHDPEVMGSDLGQVELC